MSETIRRNGQPASDGERADRTRRKSQPAEPDHSNLGSQLLAGVPARIMRPRLVFLACLAAILGFGLLMVYSASAVSALSDYGSSTYMLVRQAVFMGGGLVFAAAICTIPAHFFDNERLLWSAWGVMVLMLLAVSVFGSSAGGATRWLSIGAFQFQPSEFLKPLLIVMAAKLFDDYYEKGSLDIIGFGIRMVIAVGVPLALVVAQPDFGTTLIIFCTISAMALFAGVNNKTVLGIVAALVLLVAVVGVTQPYRLQRFIVSQDPLADEYNTTYQAALAVYAFASGGLFGRGVGNSTMKYNYLPEAHNDYILAVIGEELGFVGTVIFFAVFFTMIVAAVRIAHRSPSKLWGLMAGGSAAILLIQFLINALGILNVLPMTGKPLPFISYGGSSIISCLMLAGLILRVSFESSRKNVYERRRQRFAVYDESTAGEARPRSARRARSGFTVLDGFGVIGPKDGAVGTARPRSTGRSYERVNLNSDPTARLRTDGDGPRVRRAADDRKPYRRDRYDR